jgi:hypothetical protein
VLAVMSVLVEIEILEGAESKISTEFVVDVH